ncbi:MAG: hypothetical protein HY926_15125 [Elusimicrobia bacterium]|nr:hypothetical protein [Elusimicrobiota bacterium]
MRQAPIAALRKAACLAAFFVMAVRPAGANPSMSDDFTAMTGWLSHQLAQGLAFNAGDTFDPPHELTSRRLQPDISVGVGSMPLNKKIFPATQTPALRDMNASSIFPSTVLFPNMSMHLRAGLPGRMDMSLRFDNMTTPPGYRISSSATGKGQSNSIGMGLRKHLLGGGRRPTLTLGGHFNHIYGKFTIRTKFGVEDVAGFSADSDVIGKLDWNVSSFGFNAVVSQPYKGWTPFLGAGYNYVTGSASAHLEALSSTPLVAPIQGGASAHPEQNQARIMGGLEMDRPWMHFFANGEIKALGINAGQSWIAHIGAALPFEIGFTRVTKRTARQPEQVAAAEQYGDYGLPVPKAPPKKKVRVIRPYLPPAASDLKHPELVFIQ